MSNNTFEKWQDALPYIGKQVGVRVVESPDIKGRLSGIDFLLNDKTGDIEGVYLKLTGQYGRYEFWKCYPLVMQGIAHAPYIPVATATNVNGEIIWYRNKWKNLWLKFKRLFYKSKNYKDHMKYMNRKIIW
mgnify:CR=1 FL=1